jgi:hypothetical protein
MILAEITAALSVVLSSLLFFPSNSARVFTALLYVSIEIGILSPYVGIEGIEPSHSVYKTLSVKPSGPTPLQDAILQGIEPHGILFSLVIN